MKCHLFIRTVIFGVALCSGAANAQLFRAYLSINGSDANPCTVQAPCRLLPAALNAVTNGGEIWMLDSANYNTAPVNITKSVTILAIPGAVGSVVATGGDAIDIATPGVYVTLRNLVIVPLPGGGGTNGINMTDGSGLAVEQCSFSNLPSYAINVTTSARVRVVKSTFRGSTGVWVSLATASSSATVDVADSIFDGGGTGQGGVVLLSTNATATIKGAVRDSRVFQYLNWGLVADSTGGSVTLAASNNQVSNNNVGIASYDSAAAKVWASGNAVSGNAFGFVANSTALFESAGNNAVRNNGANTSGTMAAAPLI